MTNDIENVRNLKKNTVFIKKSNKNKKIRGNVALMSNL